MIVGEHQRKHHLRHRGETSSNRKLLEIDTEFKYLDLVDDEKRRKQFYGEEEEEEEEEDEVDLNLSDILYAAVRTIEEF